MTVDLSTLPDPSTLPIPDDVRPNARWSPLMVEIADHIGPRLTLELLVRFGGQHVRVPVNPDRNPFRIAIGDKAATMISAVFGGENIFLPVGRAAIIHARRQGVLAQVRRGELRLADAARILRTNRRYITDLINKTEEGTGLPPPPPASRRADSRQRDLFE